MSKKKLNIIIVINMLLLLISVAANIFGLVSTKSIQFVCNIVAVLFADAYLSYEYKKPAHQYFKHFLWVLAVKEVACLTNMAMYEIFPPYAFVVLLINYTCIVILAISKDFGYKNSMICSVITLVISAVCLAVSFIANSSEEVLLLAIYNGTRLVLSIVTVLMVYTKYQDKFARGSK